MTPPAQSLLMGLGKSFLLQQILKLLACMQAPVSFLNRPDLRTEIAII